MNDFKTRLILIIGLILVSDCFLPADIAAQTGCANDCPANDLRQCLGNGYQICGDHDSDGCLEWSVMMVCPSKQRCESGACVIDQCADECVSMGARQCSGGNYQVCGNYDSDWCLEWSAPAGCGENKKCIAGLCSIVNDSANGAGMADSGMAADTSKVSLVLSGLGPSGNLTDSNALLTVTTNLAADCRYDAFNKEFAAMSGFFASSDKIHHSHALMLPFNGNYTYYVRCRISGNTANSAPGVIAFRYERKSVGAGLSTELSGGSNESANAKKSSAQGNEGNGKKSITALPVSEQKKIEIGGGALIIYNPLPKGKVYQDQITLTVATDKPSDCRYSVINTGYDGMDQDFSTEDHFLHQSIVDLAGCGSYSYYVRCRNMANRNQENSTVIFFKYVDPEAPDDPEQNNAAVNNCPKSEIMPSDNICRFDQDCFCDPDCGKNGWPDDPDCSGVDLGQIAPRKDKVSGASVMLITGLVTLLAISLVFMISGIVRRLRSLD